MTKSNSLVYSKAAPALLTALILAGCGGGGSSNSGPVASALSFPLKAALATMITNGYTKNYTISGSICGTAVDTAGPAASGGTFGVQPNLYYTTESVVLTITSCSGAPGSSTVTTGQTTYYNSNYLLVGEISSSQYGEFQILYAYNPTVMVGDTGNMGIESNYTDNSHSVYLGTAEHTYVVEADTAESAIVNLITKSYNTAHQLTDVAQSRFRIQSTGALTPVSIDVGYSTGQHLTLK